MISLMKKKRGAMCFVLDEYVEFVATVSAPVLSLLIGTLLTFSNSSSAIKLDRYTASFEV